MDNVVPMYREGSSPIDLVRSYLSKRGLKDDVINLAGVRPVTIDELFTILGNNRAVWAAKAAGFTCALVFPANGDPKSTNFRARLLKPDGPDIPRVPLQDGKVFRGKYLGMTRELNVLYQAPSSVLPHNPEPHDVLLVEGSLQALRLAQDGIDAVAVSGVNNYTISDKRSPIISELLDRIKAPSTKRFIIAWDSDQRYNAQTEVATNRLALELMRYRPDGEVYIAFPPNADDGTKWGWDDFLQNRDRATFDAHLRQDMKRWDDNDFIRKCVEWQRYIYVEDSGKMFDTDPIIFKEVERGTADMTMGKGAIMLDPLATRVQKIMFNHKHYLDSTYALRASTTDMFPDVEQVMVYDEERDRHFVNTFRWDRLVAPKKGDVSWWYEIIDNICKDTPSAKDKIVKLAAHKIQNPASHLPFSIGIIGEQGAGKSLFAKSVGICAGDHTDARINLRDTDNSTWAGRLVVDVSDATGLDEDDWKKMVRDETTIIRRLYSPPREVKSRTLYITTSNRAKQLVSKGDRVMIFAGMGTRVSGEQGAKWFKLIGSLEKPGHGIAALRYHLLYEIDTTGIETMNNRTEMLGDVIEASQSRQEDVIEEMLFNISDYPDLEILPSGVVSHMLEKMGYKGSFMSLRKTSVQVGTPALKDGVKIDGVKHRFCVLKNLEKWRKCEDTDEYRKQYKMALPLLNSLNGKY